MANVRINATERAVNSNRDWGVKFAGPVADA
jgi:hypothetical protein